MAALAEIHDHKHPGSVLEQQRTKNMSKMVSATIGNPPSPTHSSQLSPTVETSPKPAGGWQFPLSGPGDLWITGKLSTRVYLHQAGATESFKPPRF